jgi:hypothetical protein
VSAEIGERKNLGVVTLRQRAPRRVPPYSGEGGWSVRGSPVMRRKAQPSEQVTVVRPHLDPVAPRNLPDSNV